MQEVRRRGGESEPRNGGLIARLRSVDLLRRPTVGNHQSFLDRFIVTVSTKMDKMKEERGTGVMAVPEQVRGGTGMWMEPTAGNPEK